MGCMCMDCAFARTVRDNHKNLFTICVCRESGNFLHQLDLIDDNCEIGIVAGYEDQPAETCTGKLCPMQTGYDVKNCKNKKCIFRTEKGGGE